MKTKINLVLTFAVVALSAAVQSAIASDSLDAGCLPNIVIDQYGAGGAIPGAELNFHIVLKNTGCAEAKGVVVADTLPSGMRFRTASLTPNKIPETGSSGGTIEWKGINIPAMSSMSIDVITSVQSKEGLLTKTVCANQGTGNTKVCSDVSTEVVETLHDGDHGSCGNRDTSFASNDHDHGHNHGGGAGTCSCPNNAPCVMTVTNACDVVFTADQTPPRSIIRLVGDAVHRCTPVAGRSGTLLSGNGITIEADNVTLDLNGRHIQSTMNPSRASGSTATTQNTGISVTGRNVVITNLHPSNNSSVEGFTTNVDFSKTVGGMLLGKTRTASQEFNLSLIDDCGGGGVRASGSQALTIRSVKILGMNPYGGSAVNFDFGYDFEIKDSWIEAMNGAVDVHNASDVRLLGNPLIRGHKGNGIYFSQLVERAMLSENYIERNNQDGVRIGYDSKYIRVQGNRIRYNWGRGINVSTRGCENITTDPNSFWMNDKGDVGAY